MKTFIFIVIFLNFILSSISLSDEVDFSSLDTRDICMALERDDCNNTATQSFIDQMNTFIDKENKTCLFVSVSKDIKTNKLTTTSYKVWSKRDQWGDNQFCSKNKYMAIGACNEHAIRGKEKCVILFDGKFSKIEIPGFKRKLEQARFKRLSGSNTNKASIYNNANNSDNIKNKLATLKKMLDEGLISQEQYDEKSSKILDDF